MTENDNRRGIFNDAPNYGSQTYNEAPAQRLSPPLDDVVSSAIKIGPKVQIRVYGIDNEMQSLGRSICNQLKLAGAEVIWFGQDNGTRYLEGIVIEPAPNDVSM